MSWTATDRFGARVAPGGLALAQELVNTHATARGGLDLLAERASATAWARSASENWARFRAQTSPAWTASAIPGTGLQSLIELRADVTSLLATSPDQRTAAPAIDLTVRAQVQLASDGGGQLSLVPTGTGADWVRSAVWSEILLAQHDGTWPRLKLCREPGCRTAFYDTSRNGSGVWHNVNTCGNVTNLRASRGRRKVVHADGLGTVGQ